MFDRLGASLPSQAGSLTSVAAIKTCARAQTVAVVRVRCDSQQRKILAIHVVLQIEHAWKPRACDLLFIPRAIGLLGAKQVTQSSLNTWPIEIAACTNPHDCPRCLRCGANTYHLGRWIFVRAARLAPPAIVVLTALKPITAAQYPVLRHIFADCAQAAQHLPRTVNVIHTPAAIPRAILILSVN